MGAFLQAKGSHNRSDEVRLSDQAYMERALELARRANGQTSPNPVVGAVVVRGGIVVGEGFHRQAGSDHAEIEAIRMAGEAAKGATLFVTLEPCNHTGRTGPCTEAIIGAGITEVFFATADPASHTTKPGAERLRRAGLAVHVGLCEDEARYDNRIFFKACTGSGISGDQIPWVIAKYASSLDGRIATATGDSQWITGDAARLRAHELRALVDAVLVGSGTLLADDPQLTARLEDFDGPQPVRIVLDSRGRIPISARLLEDCRENRTIVATTRNSSADWRKEMISEGAEIVLIPDDDSGRLRLPDLLTELARLQIQSLMVEGGATILGSFFDTGQVDEVWAFLAPIFIGGQAAPGAIAGSGARMLDNALRLENIRTETLDPDFLIRGLVQQKR